MIEKKADGMLTMLDEECRFPKATDETLASKFITKHGKSAGLVCNKL